MMLNLLRFYKSILGFPASFVSFVLSRPIRFFFFILLLIFKLALICLIYILIFGGTNYIWKGSNFVCMVYTQSLKRYKLHFSFGMFRSHC